MLDPPNDTPKPQLEVQYFPQFVVSAKQLLNIYGRDIPADAHTTLLAVAKKLQKSSWAIGHAAWYLRCTGESFVDFNQRLIDDHGLAGEAHKDSSSADCEVGCVVLLQIIAEHLKAEHPRSLQLLSAAVNLPSLGIPSDLLGVMSADPDVDTRPLFDLDLLARTDDGLYRVDETVRNHLYMVLDGNESECVANAIHAVNHIFPSGEYATWARCKDIFPQAESVLSDRFSLPHNEHTASLLAKVVRYLTLQSRYKAAESYLQLLSEVASTVFHKTDVQAIDAAWRYATLMLLMGKFSEAESCITPTQENAELILGESNLLTLRCRICLATVWRRLGKEKQSEPLLRQTLADARKYLGVTHPVVFTILNELQQVLASLGHGNESKGMMLEAYRGHMTLPGDPDLVITRRGYARKLLMESSFEEGSILAEELVQECQKYLGDHHIQTIFSSMTWADFLTQQGQLQKADAISWANYNRCIKVLGPSHPDTLLVKSNRAALVRLLGRPEEAVALHREVYTTQSEILGTSHPHTLFSQGLLARALCRVNQSKEAVELLENALGQWQQLVSSATHLDRISIVDCKSDLAHALAEQKRHYEAEEYFWEALNESRELLGSGSHRSLRIASLFADHLYNNALKTEEANMLAKKTLETRQQSLGVNHPDNYATIWLLARCERRERNFEVAKQYFRQALAFFESNFGDQHSVTKDCQADLQSLIKDQQNEMSKAPTTTYHRPLDEAGLVAVAQRLGAMQGSATLPRVSLADPDGLVSVPDTFIEDYPSSSLPHGLCAQCQRITLETLEQGKIKIHGGAKDSQQVTKPSVFNPLTFTFRDPLNARTQCRLCRLIIPPTIGSGAVSIQLQPVESQSETNNGRFKAISLVNPADESFYKNFLRAFAEPGSFASEYISAIPNMEDPVAEKTINTIKRWIQRCDELHCSCGQSLSGEVIDINPALPTRIICVTGTPRLVISSGLRGRYIALSHCWGGKLHSMTKRSNIEKHLEQLDLSGLSKTVRDAIYIVRKLSVDYLWVDSLCIIQDDKEDWAREAPKMGSIYELAYLTLAASAASNGNMGLFATLQHSDIIKLPCKPDDLSAGYMYLAPQDIFFKEEKESPLSSRGWVVQERLLSRRTVSFAATQVYWECLNDYHAENRAYRNVAAFPSNPVKRLRRALAKFRGIDGTDRDGILADVEVLKDEEYLPRAYGPAYEFQNYWRELISLYSRRGLTFPSDKLPALDGLVTKIKEQSGLEYHFGHFVDYTIDTLLTLLWTPSREPMAVPSDSRGPSWSWAALDGPLDFMLDEYETSRLEERANDMKLLAVVASESANQPLYPSLEVLVLLKHATRCKTPHEPDTSKSYLSPYPRSRYYDIGDACPPLFDWYDFDQERTGVKKDNAFEWLAEMYSLMYPQAGFLPVPDDMTYTYNESEYGAALEPPGIGWVCFDTRDTTPESFELLLVCTRAIQGRKKSLGKQYLALVVCQEGQRSGDEESLPRYRRVGVAQVHAKDWFNDALEDLILLA